MNVKMIVLTFLGDSSAKLTGYTTAELVWELSNEIIISPVL